MAARLAFKDRLASAIDLALRDKGFAKADTTGIVSSMAKWKCQPLAYPNEDIHILNRDNGKPIFAVFVTRDECRDTVSVLASNPREDAVAGRLTRAEQYFKRTFSEKSGKPDVIAEGIAVELSRLASLKTAHRMQVHDHMGRIINGSKAHDDGVSHVASSIRRALLHHVDFFVPTMHNSCGASNSDKMGPFLREFGMVAPIATEMTMPLLPHHPSGPHHIVIAADYKAARHVMKNILEHGDKSLKMPSYFLGMTMDEMYRALEPLRASHDAIVGIAHPVNFNSPSLPIRGVGLFSAVEHGHITYEQAMEYAARTDFVERWNDSIHMGEMSFESPEFKETMLALLAKHASALGVPQDMKLSANLCNMLVAAELTDRFGLGQSFGSDAHTEVPLERDYCVGGDWFSSWTRLEVPEAMQTHKLSAEDLVRGTSRKEIKMSAVVFTEVVDGIIRVVESRTKRPPELERSIRKQAREVYVRYATELAMDLARFATHGDFQDIKRMSE